VAALPIEPLDLLLDALATDSASFILGAGASVPHVPTLAQIPATIAPFAQFLTGFPGSPIQDSPLRRLIAPLIEGANATTSLNEWKVCGMTSSTVAVLLEQLIAQAHWQRLPQYDVFRLFPLSAKIVSFNWDGLARARCPQSEVIHPHGALRPRPLLAGVLEARLDYSQMYDSLQSRDWLLPGLVMPEEENAPELHLMRERVLAMWLCAPVAIIVGYSFGRGQAIDYDRVWFDTFVEAMKRNAKASIHIIAPDTSRLRGELAEALRRTINVHAWPLSWHTLARAILRVACQHGIRDSKHLRPFGDTIRQSYRDVQAMVEAAA
jgi:hypothetical protein